MRTLLLLLVFLLTPSLRAQDDGGEILARVGNDVITAAEFRERFELLPRRLTLGDREQSAAKEEMMLSLIAEKLLAQAAIDQGLDRDSVFQAEIGQVRRLLARDQLYRNEVQNKVTLSSEEIAQGMKDARRKLLVEFVHAEDSVMLAGFDFSADAAAEEPREFLRDTITVRWGEAEAALEHAVFALQPGELSSVIPSSVGWFVCRVVREEPDDLASRIGPLELRKNVEETLRLRKEEERLDEFVRDVMTASSGKAKGKGFAGLTGVIRSYARQHPDVLETGFSGSDRLALQGLLGPDGDDTLLVMKRTVLSVGQVLDRLITTGYRPETTAYPDLEASVNGVLRVWVWQGVLEELAVERGMDAHPEVDRQLRMWKDHYLAEAVRRRFMSDATVSDVELHRLRRTFDPDCEVPKLDIELIRAASDSTLRYLIQSERESSGPGMLMAAGTNGLMGHVVLENVELLSLHAMADAISDAGRGVWTRPFATDSGYVSARIIAERSRPLVQTSVRDSLEQMLKEMKGRRAEALYTAATASSRQYTVYEDRLLALPVSSVPMMTFRLLGFGGRMFAVPFVRSRTDWYSIEQESGRVVP